MTFEQQHEHYRKQCEEALVMQAKKRLPPCSKVNEAANYSLFSGGKRVRGVLTLAVCDLLKGDMQVAESFAAALEMIHAFSLIHDDLPCMDNDDMRRGKPSTHVVYGQAIALLAGDLLSISAFEALADSSMPPALVAHAVRILSHASGTNGMIYGQELDLRYETEKADEAALYLLHRHKTGALISAAAEFGECTAAITNNRDKSIEKFANNLGIVFQIVDDILDVSSTDNVLGKPVGSDKEQGKTTFITLFGVEAARREATRLTDEAIDCIYTQYGKEAAFLCAFAKSLASRVS